MRTPEYYDPIDDALNLSPEYKQAISKEEELRQPQYVFNPSNDIVTRERYVEYPVLRRGRWSYINQNVPRPATIGGLTDVEGPREVMKPIFCQFIAEEFEEAYAYLGMRRIGSFANVNPALAKLAQQTILPVLPATGPEMLDALNVKDVKARISAATRQLEQLAEEYNTTDIIKRTLQAAEQMHNATKVNVSYMQTYVQGTLHELNEGRAGRPGKTVLDDCDIAYMNLIGTDIPEEYLNFRVKPKEDVAAAVAQGVAQAMANNQQASNPADIAGAVVEALLRAGVIQPPSAQPAIKTPEVVKNGGK